MTDQKVSLVIASTTVKHSSTGDVPAYDPSKDTSLTAIVINYPEGWTKSKFFKNGDIRYVAKETADDLIAAGCATLKTNESAPAAPAVENVKQETPPAAPVVTNKTGEQSKGSADDSKKEDAAPAIVKPETNKQKPGQS